MAAVIALSAAAGEHLRRAVELSFGVALGILVADLLLSLVGRSGLTVGVVVAAAMASALLFGASVILVNQAAVSAVLLATLGTQPGSTSFTRFFSALIGCAVAIVVGPVLFRRDPIRQVSRDAERVLGRLAATLDATAEALAAGDPDAAHRALETARAAEGEIDAYEEALATADESLRLRPPGRRDLPRLTRYSEALQQVDYAIRNTRVLARGAETAVVRGVPADPDLVGAIHLLADAVRALGADLRDPSADSDARRLARQAAEEATAVLDRRSDLSANLIVAQIRSTAADILRSAGMDTREMRAALGPFPGAASEGR